MVILLRLVEAVVSICNGERRQWVVSCDWRRSGNGSLDTMCQAVLPQSEVPHSDPDMQGRFPNPTRQCGPKQWCCVLSSDLLHVSTYTRLKRQRVFGRREGNRSASARDVGPNQIHFAREVTNLPPDGEPGTLSRSVNYSEARSSATYTEIGAPGSRM
jgi:hypothetical protein